MNGAILGGSLQASQYIGGGQQTAQPSPVMVAQKQLDSATTDLHKIIGELTTRLSSVLPPDNEKQGLGEPPSPPTVAGQISQAARVVQGACSRLQDILARLEV